MLKDKLNISVIDIDLYKDNIHNKDKIKSLDVNSRFKRFRFFYNSLLVSLEDITVRAYIIKPDGKEIFNDLNVIDNSVVELEFTNQALLVPGTLKLELVLYQGDAELSSFLLEYEIIKSLRSDNSIESSNEYNSLQIALQKIELWNSNYQKLYDKWNTELTTLYNSKDKELSNLKSSWDSEFQQKYDGLNEEYSSRVFELENNLNKTDSAIQKIEGKQTIIGADSSSAIPSNKAWIKVLNDEGDTKKAQYNMYNGESYNPYHFETSEDVIINQVQNLADSGFRKLPGGLILQWGSYYATNLQAPGKTGGTLHFPIAFPNKCFSVVASPNYRSRGENHNIDVAVSLHEENTKHTSFDFVFKVEDASQWGGILWYAIGY